MNSIDNYLILGKMYIRNPLEWCLERWVKHYITKMTFLEFF